MRRWVGGSVFFGIALVLAACGTQRPAPVVDRSGATGVRPDAAAGTSLPPAPRVAKEGNYTVQRGDTLYSIATSFGVDVRELARWNNLGDAASLSVGQTLRVTAPPASAATVTPVAPVGSAEVRPLPGADASPPVATAPGATLPPAAPILPAMPSTPSPQPQPVVPGAATLPPETSKPAPLESSVQWLWPAPGKVIENFDETRNKGLDIAGNDGDPVQAAGDGEVVYVGSALRGYGNLVIVKHNDEFISAYAHNRQVLVKQGQAVKRGQRIAEFGRSDADRVKLHFEIRRHGKPVDPLRYLPVR
jgi:lipoprotein NlpD